MKKVLLMLVVVFLTIGGCVRPMNRNNRQPNEHRSDRRPAPPVEHPGPDRRPSTY